VVVEDQPELPAPEPVYWTCYWDPTMNENWHDDVACSRGSETTRPILLPDWSFVTYDDMMRAAREYEAVLNGYVRILTTDASTVWPSVGVTGLRRLPGGGTPYCDAPGQDGCRARVVP